MLFMPLVVFSLSILISMQALLDFFRSDICSVSANLANPAMPTDIDLKIGNVASFLTDLGNDAPFL